MKRVYTILVFLFFVVNGHAQEVVIGTQKWMSSNLDVEYYRNGDPIPEVTDPAAWAALTTGAWCYYNNDPTQDNRYGKLYNWYAVKDPRGLAPDGWHIPSDAEWTTLETFLGGPSVAGGKMKEAGTLNWKYRNTDATNSSGFKGLPGGDRNRDGAFGIVGSFGNWWSTTETTEYDPTSTWYRTLFRFNGGINRNLSLSRQDGFSVRCLRD